MKYLSALILASLILFSSCSGEKTKQETAVSSTKAEVINLNPKDFQEKSSNGIILDVRTPGEIDQGKIANAVELDFYQSDFLSKALEYPKDQEIYLYCAVGARSLEAARMLSQQGFTKVYHLQGGIQAWYQSGLPIAQ
ncbi:rhodanese-like domain-containing protein [Algoriphagus sp. oki45]|uniref:rhodanese-like domain-containing protein n=1 Tax=Algoriphagus sp. oki45 TaxID=3067294 RepID=UPI0027EAC508|nr:rhodanese-like domain-containing protein [Algoriphagus sp. oki45]